ncbi:MAG: glycosyltransferase family 2 protein [Ignavibacteriaceae bacterium]|nr:glycosyltransferase family 2 protein [Ignavibacteriaceae bacterium]
MSPRVSIILLNYNRAEDTAECIESLRKISYDNYEMLVIDNCSADNSYSLLKERYPEYRHYRTAENSGYTGGINYGFDIAVKDNPDYILVINNDTVAEPEFLTEMVNAMEKNKNAAAAGGLIIAEHDRNTIWFGGGKMIKYRGLAIHIDKGLARTVKSINETTEVDFITGCLTLYRTEHLKKCGYENEDYFMYLDDIELSARISRKGYKLLYVPSAVIYHKVLGEMESPFKLYYSTRNRLKLIKDTDYFIFKHIARVYFLLVITGKILVWSLINKKFARVARKAMSDYFSNNLGRGNGHLVAGL